MRKLEDDNGALPRHRYDVHRTLGVWVGKEEELDVAGDEAGAEGKDASDNDG